MNKIKIGLSFILMFFGVFFISLTYSSYLRSFQYSFFQTSFYLQIGQSSDKMMSDIEHVAHNNDVEVFTLGEYKKGADDVTIIYGTDNVLDDIKNETGIETGIYRQLLSSDIIIEYQPLSNFKAKTMVEVRFYISGNSDSASQFKSELIDLYAGPYPTSPSKSAPIGIILATWAVVYSIIIMMSLVYIYEYHKEVIINVINGNSMLKMTVKRLLLDNLFMILFYLLSYIILSNFIYAQCYMKYSVICFIVFLVLNSLCYCLLFRFQVKKAFSNVHSSKLFPIFFLSIRFGIMLLYAVIFTLSAINLKQIVSYAKQEEFFRSNQDYSYVFLRFPEYNITDQSADEHLKMYQYLTQKLRINNKREMLALAKFKINDYEGVAISEKAYQYYKDYIDVSEDLDVVNILNSDRNVILVPEEYRETIEDFEVFYGDSSIISLYSSARLLAIDLNATYPSGFVDDPIIIIQSPAEPIFDFRAPMYNLSDQELNSFLDNELNGNEEGWTFETANIYDYYLSYKQKALSIGNIYIVLIISLSLILVFTDVALLRSYLTTSKQEIAVKHILGHSYLTIFRKILAMFFSVTLLALIITVLYFYKKTELTIQYAVLSGSIVMFIDCIVWICMVKKHIIRNLTKILKGGAL